MPINPITTANKFSQWVTAINALITGVNIDSNGAIAGVLKWASNAEAQAKSAANRVITPSNLASLDSTSSFKGMVELATDAEAQTGTDTVRATTPANVKSVLDNRNASTTATGLVELATNAESQTGSDTVRATTPAGVKYVLDNRNATASATGLVELATDAEAQTGTDTVRATTPANVKYVLDNRNASQSATGLVELATDLETTTGTDTVRATTPANVKAAIDARVASDTVKGIVELATDLETIAGTDDVRATTPKGLKAALDAKAPIVQAKTGNYTLQASDNGTEIDFTTAGFALTLLAAGTAGNGYSVWVRNSASTGEIQITGTVGGLVNIKLRPGDSVYLRSNNTAWREVQGLRSFESAELTPALNTYFTVAHGLQQKPSEVELWARCKTAVGNYSINDEVNLDWASITYWLTVNWDATNIIWNNQQTYYYEVANKSVANSSVDINPTNWRFFIRARVRKG